MHGIARWIFGLGLATTLLGPAKSNAATITVTGTGDAVEVDLQCTLREAIQAVNSASTVNECVRVAAGGIDSIIFSLGSGAHTIQPSSELPAVSLPVLINGLGTTGNPTLACPAPLASLTLTVEIDGSNAGEDKNGLSISGGSSTVRGLAINRFTRAGIALLSSENMVQCNFVGTGPTGTTLRGNALGVLISGGARNIVGTDGNETNDANEGNLLGANQIGLVIQDVGADENHVSGNLVGTSKSGTSALGNNQGVLVAGGPTENIIGTDGDGLGDTAERNVISANGGGIELSGTGTEMNRVAGNFIGTDITGDAALGNGIGGGVILANGANNNVIGTDGNGQGDMAESNVIAGNNSQDVFINSAEMNRVAGNFIGTNKSGTAPLAASNGVILSGNSNVIGTNSDGVSDTIERNVVSSVEAFAGQSNTVAGNFIGIDATGNVTLNNCSVGVQLITQSSNNVVGTNGDGTRDAAEGNVISGCGTGVLIDGLGSDMNRVAGNFIGTAADGITLLGNGGAGIAISDLAQDNVIGTDLNGTSDDIEGNRIVGSAGSGIRVTAFPGNALRRNSIHTNGGLGIDLGTEGVTPNDVGDPDTGPNELQNFPVLTSAIRIAGTTTVSGTLNSTANQTFVLEFYSNAACDSSQSGEGQTFLGRLTVATGDSGNIGFSTTFSAPSVGEQITVTATDSASGTGNTSEFSACQPVIGPTPTPTATPTITATATPVTMSVHRGRSEASSVLPLLLAALLLARTRRANPLHRASRPQ